MPELIVLGRVFIGAGRVVMGAFSIDTSGGGSGFASGKQVLLTRLRSGAGTTPILMTAFSVGKWEHSQDTSARRYLARG